MNENTPATIAAVIIGIVFWQTTGNPIVYYVAILFGLVSIPLVNGYRETKP